MILPERVLGSSGVNMSNLGRAIAPIFTATCSRSSAASASLGSTCGLEDDERRDRLAGHRIGATHDGRLGHRGMVDERGLDLDRADPVAGDLHDVVDATQQPEVAVRVDPAAVAREVHPREPSPVGAQEALGVLVDAAQHRRPRPGEHEVAAARAVGDLVAVGVDHLRGHAREGCVAEPGRSVVTPGQGRDQDHAGLGLPPRVDDRAAPAADVRVVPEPGLGVDRLADRSQQAQGRQVVLRRPGSRRAS